MLNPAGPWSIPVRLMFNPNAEYHALSARDDAGSWAHALSGPALTALTIGAVTAASATGRITLSLVLSGAICWSFVPLLQLATAAPFVVRRANPPIPPARALELWFLAHGPWTLWIFLAIAVLATTSAPQTWVVVSGIAPALWTARLLTVFFQQVLHLPAGRAIRRTVAHQGITWLLILTYIEVMTATFTRVLGAIAR
jgi:hypothetical protein